MTKYIFFNTYFITFFGDKTGSDALFPLRNVFADYNYDPRVWKEITKLIKRFYNEFRGKAAINISIRAQYSRYPNRLSKKKQKDDKKAKELTKKNKKA